MQFQLKNYVIFENYDFYDGKFILIDKGCNSCGKWILLKKGHNFCERVNFLKLYVNANTNSGPNMMCMQLHTMFNPENKNC